jgi:hypothetical protein
MVDLMGLSHSTGSVKPVLKALQVAQAGFLDSPSRRTRFAIVTFPRNKRYPSFDAAVVATSPLARRLQRVGPCVPPFAEVVSFANYVKKRETLSSHTYCGRCNRRPDLGISESSITVPPRVFLAAAQRQTIKLPRCGRPLADRRTACRRNLYSAHFIVPRKCDRLMIGLMHSPVCPTPAIRGSVVEYPSSLKGDAHGYDNQRRV